MFTTLAHVRIGDAERFIEIFSSHGLEARKAHGSLGAISYRVPDQPGLAVVLIDWADQASFERFRSDPMVRETMRSGGALEPPTFTFLEQTGVYPA
jgi:quinol monooxygenase YgiN